ncbi:thioredoxin-like domain-containing protein [Proteiniphilum acetatigenes]|uniref:thioredoxin-like domain-containing protein n=1 Tax=Proteiniphilum acetatigenes TaxID=294710 RepID=UPI000368D30D|nr:thioredoxin-like domain-containing protein [Proteiniphilum acetatigenes]SFK71195.1 protein of unknown function [Porphyromonadaceae bacterium KH3CP3RA]
MILSLGVILPGFSQGYEIAVTIENIQDTVILGHYYARENIFIADDTLFLDHLGSGVFKGDKPLPKGLYFLKIGNHKMDIIMGDKQQFTIHSDISDLIHNARFASSSENDIFYQFQRHNLSITNKIQKLTEQWIKAPTNEQKTAIQAEIQSLHGKERIAYLSQAVNSNKDTYLNKYLRSLMPPLSTPTVTVTDMEGKVTDPGDRYDYYRDHYFDNFDIFDPELLRTPYYTDRLLGYMGDAIPQHPDTICAETDKILIKAQYNDEIFRCILMTLFNYYVKSPVMVHENVWVHIAEKWYIPYATWSNFEQIERLRFEVALRKPCLVGKYAPPIEKLMSLSPEQFEAAIDTAIKSDLNTGSIIQDFRQSVTAKYTAILFWDVGCDHCKIMIEELYKVFEEGRDKGLQVVAIQVASTKNSKAEWIDYINKQKFLGWINGWSPNSVKYMGLYNITTVPVIYLLDDNKNIIGKNLTPDQVKRFIEAYEK